MRTAVAISMPLLIIGTICLVVTRVLARIDDFMAELGGAGE